MGKNDPEVVELSADWIDNFLKGLFATWYARKDGRETANAADRKLAANVASSSKDMFIYYQARRERQEAAKAA